MWTEREGRWTEIERTRWTETERVRVDSDREDDCGQREKEGRWTEIERMRWTETERVRMDSDREDYCICTRCQVVLWGVYAKFNIDQGNYWPNKQV